MYDEFLSVPEMQEYLGIGRNYVLRLCADKPHGFPAVKVGNRYRAMRDLLSEWRAKWYAGEFEI